MATPSAPANAVRKIASGAAREHHTPPEAPSAPALFVAAARAVADGVRGRSLDTTADWEEEVSIAAEDPGSLLAAWIDELVRRSLASSVRFEEVDVVYVSDHRVVASIRGVRLERTRDQAEEQAHREACCVQR